MPNEMFGRDLRTYQAETEQAAELYHHAAKSRQGHVIFIAGQAKSGRTGALEAIGRHLREAEPHPKIICGRFVYGKYESLQMTSKRFVMKETAVASGETLSTLAKIISPRFAAAADLIGQLILNSVAATDLAKTWVTSGRNIESPEDVKRFVRAAAKADPIVYLIDDLDEASDDWLITMLWDFAIEVAKELPLLFFVAVEGAETLGQFRKSESSLLLIARSLAERGLAKWWGVKPLNREEVSAWIGPASIGIAEQLHGVTGGNAGWIVELWRHWEDQGRIFFSDQSNEWRWNSQKKPELNLIYDIINIRLKNIFGNNNLEALQEARDILAISALEGDRFTADAVARVIGWERDRLINYLDDNLVVSKENPGGLLRKDGSLTIEDSAQRIRTLWRYAFAQDLFWFALERYGFAAEMISTRSAELAKALSETYSPKEQLIAKVLARLYQNCKDDESAQSYQRMAAYGALREFVFSRAKLLLSANKGDWTEWDYRWATGILLEAANKMYNAYPHEETLKIAEAAYKMTDKTGDVSDRATALLQCGMVHFSSGDIITAGGQLQSCFKLTQQIRNKSLKAACLRGLGEIDLRTGSYNSARTHYEQALAVFREIRHQKGEAAVLRGLGEIDLRTGSYNSARTHYEQALVIDRNIGHREDEAAALYGLGEVDRNTSSLLRVPEIRAWKSFNAAL